jgi:dTDP-4-dehydrorhamnose reductase
MRILVIGSNGMAGHMVVSYLRTKKRNVKTVARQNADFCLDIESTETAELFFNNIKKDFDFIINCVGLLVKDSIENPDRAILINSWFPHFLERTFKDSNTKIVHLSTDCVFDGADGKYTENSFHTEKNFYGRSKSLGELNNDKDITFRMSIIGPEIKDNGTGLFNFIYKNTNSELQGWDNAWWNGITTLELAKCIEKYLNNPSITGIYHLVNNTNQINKFELLNKINYIFDLDKKIVRTQGPKPINKILIDSRNEFNFEILNYDDMLTELKEYVYSGSYLSTDPT